MPVSSQKRAQLAASPAASPAARKSPPRRARERNSVHRDAVQLGALEQHLGYFIRRAQVWVFADFIRALKTLEISPAQYSVLVIIDANTGLSQSALAQTLGIQRARMVRLLDRLEARGLTRRLQSANDGRTHALQLTPKGQAALGRARKLADQHEARLIDRLGSDSYRAMKSLLRDFQMPTA
jgi:DNA-binding MarR family transcriptional regulator